MSFNNPFLLIPGHMGNEAKDVNFRLNRFDFLVILLLVLKLFLTAIFFPELEMPDEAYHTDANINYDYHGNLYFSLMHRFYVLFKNSLHLVFPSLKLNPNFHFVSNSFIFIHSGFNSLFNILLRSVHVFCVLLFIFLLYFVLKRIKMISVFDKIFIFRLNLLFLSWSAVSLSLVGVSPDFFIYLYEALFFVLLVYYNQVLPLLLFNLVMNIFVDNNPIIMIVVTIFYVIFFFLTRAGKNVLSLKNKFGLVAIAGIMVLIYAVLVRVGIISGLFPYLKWVITDGYAATHYRILKSLGCLFLSLYYVGGSMSLLAFWPEYILFLVFSLFCLLRFFTRDGLFENRFFLYILSSFLTFNIAILTLPAIDQGRYYYFLIPALIIIFDRYFLRSRLFVSNKYYLATGVVFFISSMVKLVFAVYASF